MEEITEQKILFTQQDVKYMVTFALATLQGTEKKIQQTQVR